MGRAYDTHRSEEKCKQGFGAETSKKQTAWRWEDNIEVNLKEKAWERVDWIHVVQDRDMLRAFVNMVLNLHVT